MSLLKKAIVKLVGSRAKISSINFAEIQSVLIKPIGDAIGDSIAHSAHIKQLKAANPNIKIGIFVSSRSRLIYELSGLVDVFFEDKAITYFKQRKRWDLYLDFMPSYTTRSLLLEKILSPKFIFTFYKREKKYYSIHSINNYNHHADITDKTHVTDYLMDSLLGQYLNREESCYPKLLTNLPEVSHLWQKNKIKILIAPEGSTRRIPAKEIAAFLDNLPENLKERCDLLVSISDAEKNNYKNMPDIRLLPKVSLAEYIGLINKADFVLSVDGGSVHIACACRRPLLAFYADNARNLAIWSPKCEPEIPCKVIKSREPGDNNHTENFDMKEASIWLIKQIDNLA